MSISSYFKRDRDPSYIPDENQFEKLNAEFDIEGNQRIYVYGPPGIGKSSFVNEFGYRQNEQNKTVFWLDVETTQKISEELNYLLRAFNVEINDEDDERAKLQKLNDSIHNIENRFFLFIFDNLEKYDHIAEFIRNLPSKVKVLITTRPRFHFLIKLPARSFKKKKL